ncbi:uncharacterized protein LOC133675458 isoform X1 [Populus nigra]|uniref:uncharacterized protein LOC133675458 isoform X1 n=1 Tax=Populus nigra TaxID=3691 RepID=UPI002B277514|nr:uncharacterized protein LOC133675458 isoform X1 [Populus nigra]XP_061952815.1 uncharacterized protein LOC133675458 isoform X1 [Populus nigra]XP_061952816.1 uncharacterized protein LOC133675458 isoform X1 [Populus nigra]XP_061952817.1 uncharacterized protein LOC133675458 isoform X1 [Populus nigra]XP_061952818.1 uncharacterized protein LOC133675458 isoform X1 [Populus nigra]XP_061952819.1 uncharacterized protein LOC133675458 isoform X1 [Populus nigra]XP_061952820.1 uncharacterized protein LO
MEYVDERQAGESTCGCSTMASKPHYKSFKFIDNSRELRGLEGDKGTALELHRQKGEAVARNQPGVDAFMAWVNPVHGTEYPTSLSELEESRGRRKIYIKSNVMDSDMPEMVAFFQDSNYHFVKDIFMDGEVYCKDICSVENCQLDHNSISSILNFNVESCSASTVGTQDSVPSISNDSEYVEDVDCHNLLINQHGSRMSMKDFDGQEYVLVEKNVHGSHMVKKVPSKEAILSSSIVLYTTEEVYYDCPTSAATFRNEVDDTISKTEADFEQVVETESMSKPEDGMSGTLTSSSRSLGDENVQGESSFFAVDPPPGLTYSEGPIYCGSVSSHSFAFPILPSEWDGSPERMASTDKVQFRRHQRRRMRFLCCKF